MKTLKKLEELLTYYTINRKVGHTTLLKEGTKNHQGKKFVLCHCKRDYQFLEVKPEEVISVENIEALRGCNTPLILDNDAMIVILSESIKKINELKEENKELRNKKQCVLIKR